MIPPKPIKPITATWLSEILAERRLEIIQALIKEYPTLLESPKSKAILEKAVVKPKPQSVIQSSV